MESITTIKENILGDLKGRQLSDRQKQYARITWEDARYPTVHLDSMTITSGIDTKEKHGIAVIDLTGELARTDNQYLLHMVLRGEM